MAEQIVNPTEINMGHTKSEIFRKPFPERQIALVELVTLQKKQIKLEKEFIEPRLDLLKKCPDLDNGSINGYTLLNEKCAELSDKRKQEKNDNASMKLLLDEINARESAINQLFLVESQYREDIGQDIRMELIKHKQKIIDRFNAPEKTFYRKVLDFLKMFLPPPEQMKNL